jgi:hypothetical protein
MKGLLLQGLALQLQPPEQEQLGLALAVAGVFIVTLLRIRVPQQWEQLKDTASLMKVLLLQGLTLQLQPPEQEEPGLALVRVVQQ